MRSSRILLAISSASSVALSGAMLLVVAVLVLTAETGLAPGADVDRINPFSSSTADGTESFISSPNADLRSLKRSSGEMSCHSDPLKVTIEAFLPCYGNFRVSINLLKMFHGSMRQG